MDKPLYTPQLIPAALDELRVMYIVANHIAAITGENADAIYVRSCACAQQTGNSAISILERWLEDALKGSPIDGDNVGKQKQ